MHYFLLILLLRTALAIYEEPLNNIHLDGEECSSSLFDESSEEMIPVKPNPLRRLQANYETSSLEPGVSVIEDCGCPGCCTMTPTTVYETITLTSTNYCFFTSMTITTTDTTLITTVTTTSVLTKTSNLKILETITKFTTQTILSQFFITSTISRSLTRFSTSVQVVAESTLEIVATTSYITGAVTRQIPYFTPYTVYIDTFSVTFTAFEVTFDLRTTTSTFVIYGNTSIGTLVTTSIIPVITEVGFPLIVTTYITTTTNNIFGQLLYTATIPVDFTASTTQSVTISSTNIESVTVSATSATLFGFTQLATASQFVTFSLLYP